MLSLHAPEGAAWEFMVLFGIVLIGPILVERFRLPGIIGLLIGGFAIGPHGLGIIAAGNTTVPDVGQLGLLYLMFVAGVELDLSLLRLHKRSVIIFSVLTFSVPMILGSGVGFLLGWSAPAALLLGSLLVRIPCSPTRSSAMPGSPPVRRRRPRSGRPWSPTLWP